MIKVKIAKLFKAEWIMLFGELKQYYLNYIFYNVSLLMLFVGIFYSFFQDRSMKALILLFGLVMWQLSTSALSYLSYVIQDESMLGTLEQIFMTRTNVFSVFTSKVLVNFAFSLAKALILFLISLFLFNVQGIFFSLGIKIFYIIIIIIIAISSFYALGLMFGGLALFHKRLLAVINVLTYVLLFFTNITVSIEALPMGIRFISYLIPISWASKCIEEIVKQNMFTSELLNNFIALIVTSVSFGLLGYIVFKKSIKKAKSLGKLGHY